MDLIYDASKSIEPYIIPENNNDILWNDIISFLEKHNIKMYSGKILSHKTDVKIYQFRINAPIENSDTIFALLDEFQMNNEIIQKRSLDGANVSLSSDRVILFSVILAPDDYEDEEADAMGVEHEYSTYKTW